MEKATFRCWSCQALCEERMQVELDGEDEKWKIPVCRPCWKAMKPAERIHAAFEFTDRLPGGHLANLALAIEGSVDDDGGGFLIPSNN